MELGQFFNLKNLTKRDEQVVLPQLTVMQDDFAGPSERVSGLYYAFGFSGSGFQIGPGVGETLAEVIHTGITTIPLGAYRIGRFATATAAVNVTA